MVRITVIATGFSADQFGGNTPREYSRKDLFASTAQDTAASASSSMSSLNSSAPTTPRPSVQSTNRLTDEDYIPDFLKRR